MVSIYQIILKYGSYLNAGTIQAAWFAARYLTDPHTGTQKFRLIMLMVSLSVSQERLLVWIATLIFSYPCAVKPVLRPAEK